MIPRLPLVVKNVQKLIATDKDLKKSLFTLLKKYGELSPKDRLQLCLNNIDQAISEIDPKEYTCRAGCYYCCYHQIEVTQTELENIKKYKNHIQPKSQACHFLDSSGKCTIYQNRPIICRLTHVRTPAENCQDIGDNQVVHHPMVMASLYALAFYMLEDQLISLNSITESE